MYKITEKLTFFLLKTLTGVLVQSNKTPKALHVYAKNNLMYFLQFFPMLKTLERIGEIIYTISSYKKCNKRKRQNIHYMLMRNIYNRKAEKLSLLMIFV